MFIHSEAEAEHYDNIAEPGRSWLLNIIRQYNIEPALCGHVHQYFYNRVDQCSLYTMPPTSFTRQDYAELFKVESAAEYGRDDIDKYSVAVVDVYQTGHRLRIIPTHGRALSKPIAPAEHEALEIQKTDEKNLVGAAGTSTENLLQQLKDASVEKGGTSKITLNRKKRGNIIPDGLTVHLRHAWHESVDLPYNGPMEEFSRKRARNDYVFMRLEQMGIKDVRIPLQDIVDPHSYQRVRDYIATGFRFHGFCLQQQIADLTSGIGQQLVLLASFEVITTTPDHTLALEDLPPSVADLPLRIGHAKTGAHQRTSGKPFAHSVSSGFQWDDHDKVITGVTRYSVPVDGIVFQIPWEANLKNSLDQMQNVFSVLPFKCIANIRLANSNPAESNFDDAAILDRIKSAIQQAGDLDKIELQIDTAMDIDRGYSPRHGLINRLGNLRPAGHWLYEQTLDD